MPQGASEKGMLSLPTSYIFSILPGNKKCEFDKFSRHYTTHFVNHTSVNISHISPTGCTFVVNILTTIKVSLMKFAELANIA